MTGEGGVWLPAHVAVLLVDRISDPAWRASLAPKDSQAISWLIVAGHHARSGSASGSIVVPAPREECDCGEVLGTEAAAQRAGVSSRSVRYAAQAGRLRGTRVGPSWQFSPIDVDAYARTVRRAGNG